MAYGGILERGGGERAGVKVLCHEIRYIYRRSYDVRMWTTRTSDIGYTRETTTFCVDTCVLDTIDICDL